MKRRIGLFVAASGIMVVIAALAAQKQEGKLLLLEWAAKGSDETPPLAIIIELGLTDAKPITWNGRATVSGAKVVHREGYGFTAKDKLVGTDAWEVATHRPIRLPKNNPVLAKVEGIVPVGIVLHLTDVKPDASLALTVTGANPEKVSVPLKELLAGQSKSLWENSARVRRISAATPITKSEAENDFPAAAYGPDGTLWVAYIGYRLLNENQRIEAAQLKSQPVNFRAYDTPTFGDQLFVQYCKTGKWSSPIAVTGAREDLVGCAIAVEKDGMAWVVYSARRNGKHQLYQRKIRTNDRTTSIGEETVASDDSGHLKPVACTDQKGEVSIFSTIPSLSAWHTTISAGPGGITLAQDAYSEGDYDVSISTEPIAKDGKWKRLKVASSPRFEARPSLCYDAKGRLWIAYEEGPELWGKDWGPLVPKKGTLLYSSRSIRVVCLQDGKLLKPAAELPTSPSTTPTFPNKTNAFENFAKQARYTNPALGLDGKGRLWVTYRQKFGTRYSTHEGSYWISYARRLDGDKWSEPIELHHSDGLLDCTAVVLPHKAGGIRVLHNGDGRWTRTDTLHNQIYESYVDLPGEPMEPKLEPHQPGTKDPQAAAKEQADVKRIRDYRIEVAGKKYQLLRGEFHRHTDISMDGGADGSLEDMFRYAIDASAIDWIGCGDHDNGAGREYTWWLTQKMTDAVTVPNRFTPVFSYERSVSYPHGHRNCVFARRGIRTLPRLAEEDPEKRVAGIHADDTKMLYRYLHELGGVCAVHTSATSMGTDWRDNDPVVEPLVEIYQGDRMSYEMQGAPRAGYDPKTNKYPPNIAGWFPKGFINLALDKGYRLGFQSSSDHWSTHSSFCVCIAERHDRQGIVDSMRKRHCYAATDNIILDVRGGNHLMGDEWKTAEAPALDLHVIGTAPLAKVEILKDGEVVHTVEPKKEEYQGRWTDPMPKAGTHCYYVRVQQADGEIAWGSPMWIEHTK